MISGFLACSWQFGAIISCSWRCWQTSVKRPRGVQVVPKSITKCLTRTQNRTRYWKPWRPRTAPRVYFGNPREANGEPKADKREPKGRPREAQRSPKRIKKEFKNESPKQDPEKGSSPRIFEWHLGPKWGPFWGSIFPTFGALGPFKRLGGGQKGFWRGFLKRDPKQDPKGNSKWRRFGLHFGAFVGTRSRSGRFGEMCTAPRRDA